MNGGVEILLARMETHPEEFFNHGSRWVNLIMDFERSLDPADYEKLTDGIARCRQEEFTQKVMNKLIGEEQEDRQAIKSVRQIQEEAMKTLNNVFTEVYEDLANSDEDMAEDGFTPAQRMAIKRAKGEI